MANCSVNRAITGNDRQRETGLDVFFPVWRQAHYETHLGTAQKMGTFFHSGRSATEMSGSFLQVGKCLKGMITTWRFRDKLLPCIAGHAVLHERD